MKLQLQIILQPHASCNLLVLTNWQSFDNRWRSQPSPASMSVCIIYNLLPQFCRHTDQEMHRHTSSWKCTYPQYRSSYKSVQYCSVNNWNLLKFFRNIVDRHTVLQVEKVPYKKYLYLLAPFPATCTRMAWVAVFLPLSGTLPSCASEVQGTTWLGD